MMDEEEKDLERQKRIEEIEERRRKYLKQLQPSRRFNPGQVFKPGQLIKESGGLEPLVSEQKD